MWLNSWHHIINKGAIFRNVIQENIQKGSLKFPEKEKGTMGIDSDQFPTAEVNMVTTSPAKGKEKVNPSELTSDEPTPMVIDSLKP